MKKKNIKSFYRNRIKRGWRCYLSLHFPYEMLELQRSDFMTYEEMANILGLETCEEDSSFVGHFQFYDPNDIKYGVKRFIEINFDWGYLDKSTGLPPKYDDCPTYIIIGNKYWKINVIEGYKNPEWTPDSLEDVPYWLGDDSDYISGYYTDGDSLRLLKAYINESELSDDLFSGNIGFKFISGHNISNKVPIINDLSILSSYCKTIYTTPKDNYMDICFAIRYSDDIEDFLGDLKKIINKYKIKKL